MQPIRKQKWVWIMVRVRAEVQGRAGFSHMVVLGMELFDKAIEGFRSQEK